MSMKPTGMKIKTRIIWIVSATRKEMRVYEETDETVNLISESSKLSLKEYQTWHDWVGKVIYWELCKRLKFDHTNKWYIYKVEFVLKNETHKIIWDFEIQTDYLIPARRLYEVLIKNKIKKKNWYNGFCYTDRPQRGN